MVYVASFCTYKLNSSESSTSEIQIKVFFLAIVDNRDTRCYTCPAELVQLYNPQGGRSTHAIRKSKVVQ